MTQSPTDRLIDPAPQQADSPASDQALRPRRLADFTGQKQTLENLEVFLRAASKRGEALDHTLLFGPPGLGKTTLAQIISHELGVNFRSTSGPVIQRAGDLAALLTNLEPRDVLFIDEIHRLNPAVEEILYPAMEDFGLDLMIGEGPAARSVRIDLVPFTLVGATTRSGLVTQPLRDRFGIPLHLDLYEPDDLCTIVLRAARLLNLELQPEGAMEIARRSRGTPRVAGRLLRRIRDFALMEGAETITPKLADHALRRLDVDEAGFDSMDRRYLSSLVTHYNGGPVGIETLAAMLSEQRDVLEDVIEPYLLRQGVLQRTARGRMITSSGYRLLGLPPPQGELL